MVALFADGAKRVKNRGESRRAGEARRPHVPAVAQRRAPKVGRHMSARCKTHGRPQRAPRQADIRIIERLRRVSLLVESRRVAPRAGHGCFGRSSTAFPESRLAPASGAKQARECSRSSPSPGLPDARLHSTCPTQEGLSRKTFFPEKCARVDSNHHPAYAGQGPQPHTAGVDRCRDVQIVHFAWIAGNIGRI